MSQDSSVTIGVFESETEAQAVAGLLRSHGIRCHLAHDRLGAGLPIPGMSTEIRLRVPAEHQARALELLGAQVADSDEPPSAIESTETSERRWSDSAQPEPLVPGGIDTRTAMQGVFVIAGIALVIAGLNGSRPLVFVGAGLIALAIVGRVLGRQDTDGRPCA